MERGGTCKRESWGPGRGWQGRVRDGQSFRSFRFSERRGGEGNVLGRGTACEDAEAGRCCDRSWPRPGACTGLGEERTAHSCALSRSCPLVPALGLFLRLSPTRVFCPPVFTGPGWSLLPIQAVTESTVTQEAPPTLPPRPHPPRTLLAPSRAPRCLRSGCHHLQFCCSLVPLLAYRLFLLLGTNAPESESSVVSSANPRV